jgi:D-serine deaminase-like pyridoxal phosphate-dependent protein
VGDGGQIGRRIAELDTPALIVDLEALDRNVARIAHACRSNGKAWRPHTKGLKTTAVAHKALSAGAIGVTCAKLGEAEVMAAAGIGDILIANQIVGPEKARRLAGLARQARLTVAVDSEYQLGDLDRAARAFGARIGVVIEVDIGIRRAGVIPGPAVVDLAAAIASFPGLDFRGVMGWEGHACPIADSVAKEAAIVDAVGQLTGCAEACRAAGLPVEIVSCGGTGTYGITARQPGVTEIQAGGGVFGDLRYRTRFGVDLDCALTVATTVISRPTATRIICDAGKKSMSDDAVKPEPLGVEGIVSVTLSAEHATIELDRPSTAIAIGDKVVFVVGYSDITVNLHDVLLGQRDGLIETAWPLWARGKTS